MRTEEINKHLIGLKYSEVIDKLEIEEDNGGCCGYASCEQNSFIPEGVDKDSLTLVGCVRIDYELDWGEDSRSVINFVFSDGNDGQFVAGYELEAGSGSGWSYGAYVQLKLNGEVLAEEYH